MSEVNGLPFFKFSIRPLSWDIWVRQRHCAKNTRVFFHESISSTRQTRHVGPELVYCWATVVDGDPTSNQQRFNVCHLLAMIIKMTPSRYDDIYCMYWPKILAKNFFWKFTYFAAASSELSDYVCIFCFLKNETK